jgi:hypothetical protein
MVAFRPPEIALYSPAVSPVAPTSISPEAKATATGWADLKKIISTFKPSSLKNPLSWAINMGAEEVKRNTPALSLTSAITLETHGEKSRVKKASVHEIILDNVFFLDFIPNGMPPFLG